MVLKNNLIVLVVQLNGKNMNDKTLNNINKNHFLNNINSYYIKIDYYDEKGKKKYI